MAKEEARAKEDFYNVLADAKFHFAVDEGTEGAVRREYTVKGKDGNPDTTGVKYELLYGALSGKITKVAFHEGDYGKNLLLTLEDGDETFVVSLGTNSNFGEDMLKKLLNIDMDQPVRLVPYSLKDKNTGKDKRGITVYQGQDSEGKFITADENKVQSYFHKYNEETKTTTSLHGFPKAPVAKKGKEISKDEWKVWFAQCRLFMIDFIEEKLGLDSESEEIKKANAAFDGE